MTARGPGAHRAARDLRRQPGAARAAGALALLLLAAVTGCDRRREDLEPILDLVTEVAFAETYREVDEIDLGTPQGAQHLLWGWSWNEREPSNAGGETTYTWGLRHSSGLRFYLVTRRDLRLELRGRPGPGAPQGPQEVTIELNGQVVERLTLEPRELGWVTYSVVLPRETLTAGWNTLALGYRHAVEPREAERSGDRRPLAVAWDRVRLDPAPPARAAGPEAVAGDAQGGATAPRIRLPLGTEVVFHAPLPAGSVLAFDSLQATGTDSRLLVQIQWEDGEAVDLVSLQASPRSRRLELSGGSDAGGARLARLALRAVPAGWLEAREATAEGAMEVVAPRVLAPRPAASPGAAAAAPPAPTPGGRPDILVYVIDTLRADRVGAYDPDARRRGLTPTIDELADRALVFEDALTQAPWTRPVVASLLTGLPPLAHGVTTLRSRLPPAAVTLPEILRQLPGGGYRTAGWSTNWHVIRRTGLAQGLEHFHFFPNGPRADVVHRAVLTWVDRRLEAARRHPGEARPPLFLYVHALDPHAPYDPPTDLRRRFAPDAEDPEAGSHEYLKRAYAASGRERAKLVAPLPGLYDAEVALADRELGELLGALEDRGLRDDLLLVLLADHGEAFDEHGQLGHGKDLYQETLRIPLIIDLPGREPGRLAGTALPMDVPATVLAALGVAIPSGMAGADLLAEPRVAAGRPAFAHLDYEGRTGVSVVLGEWKLIEPLSLRFGRRPELYHLPSDPGEREDLAARRPVRTGYLRALVRRHLAATAGGAAAGERMELDPDVRRGLEALGYL